MPKKTCPHCKAEVPGDAAFCIACGQQIPAEPPLEAPAPKFHSVCPQCNYQQQEPGAQFCQMCGFPLEITEAPTPRRTRPQPGEAVQPRPPTPTSQGAYIQSQDPRQPQAGTTPATVPPPTPTLTPTLTPTPTPTPTPPKKRRIPRALVPLLVVVLVAVGGYYGWQWFQGRDKQAVPQETLEACEPVKPDESYTPSNFRDLSGSINGDTYFEGGEEYTIAADSTLTVPDGSTLLIEPGARVRFGQGARLVVEGTLLACGRSNRRILFTADTTSGYPGFWSGIEFRSAEPDTVLGHATFEFGGQESHGVLWIESSDLHIEDLKFDSNQWYALSMDPDSYPRLRPPLSVENGPDGWEIRAGDLTQQQTWSAEVPFVVNGGVEVREKASLTLPAGSLVKFLPKSYIRFYGDADIVGTASSPVVFTSVNDLGDENAPDPQPGDWLGLVIHGREGSAELKHVEIRYAGDPSTINGCLVLTGADPLLEEITIRECGTYAISSDLDSQPQISDLSIEEDDPTLWWELRESSISGNITRRLSAVEVSNHRQIITPVVTGWIGVEEKATLQVDPGMALLFKGGKNAGFWSQGRLQLNGTRKEPVLLTSWQDAAIGGNGDAAAGDWGGLHLYNTIPNDTSLGSLQVRYGGADNNNCLRLENASPKIKAITIEACSGYPVSSDAASQPQIEGIEIQQNEQANQWEIRKSSLVERKEWQWDSLTGSDGEPILRMLTGAVTIKPDATLVLQPGLVLKFSKDAGLVVQGGLQARGQKNQPITMTSWRDPYGGGTESGAQPGDWAGVAIDGSQGTQRLEYVTIRYAGNPKNGISCLNLQESAPNLNAVTLTNCAYYPIGSDLVSDPQVSDLSLSENEPADEWVIRKSNLKKGLDRTWTGLTQAGSDQPILRTASGWLSIESGARLDMEPGTILKFTANTGLWVGGNLNAQGEPGSKVVFTSWRDPAYSLETGVQAGDWVGLAFENAQGETRLDQVEIRYAGGERNPRGALTLVSTSPTLENLTISDSAWYPISLDIASRPSLSNPVFDSNSPVNTVEIRASSLADPGEHVLSAWTGANGQPLSPVVTGELLIGENATLRLDPGSVLKFDQNGKLYVRGGLVSNNATLTSIHDDEYGGDTDGSIGGENRWHGLVFEGRRVSQVENTLIRFATNGIWLVDAAPTLSDNRIEDCWEAALHTDFISNPSIQGLSLARNGINGLVYRGSALPDGETHWSLIGNPEDSLVRVLLEPLLVGENARLRIDPGVILKFASQTGLVVDGQLYAGERDSSAPVIFTAFEDDEAGGDTNGESGDTRRGSWLGISANPKDTNALLSLFNVHIRYGNIGLYLTNLTDWAYQALTIENSQLLGLSCDASITYDPEDEEISLFNNGSITESCPTPDR